MNKILIVGAMNKLMENLNEILSVDFSVQVCTMDSELMEKMLGIVKPDLILFCLVGVYDEQDLLFRTVERVSGDVPVLVLERAQETGAYQKYYETEQFEQVICPIRKRDLVTRCFEKIGEEKRIYTENELTGYILEEAEKKHILVVDDSALLLRNIKAMLEPTYKVSVANSGEQALRFIPKKKPDLILLDYEMPGMDGRETFEKIKEDEIGKNIPLVFLTGVADKQHIYAVLQMEPAGYVLKPPSVEKLESVIENILNPSGK